MAFLCTMSYLSFILYLHVLKMVSCTPNDVKQDGPLSMERNLEFLFLFISFKIPFLCMFHNAHM